MISCSNLKNSSTNSNSYELELSMLKKMEQQVEKYYETNSNSIFERNDLVLVLSWTQKGMVGVVFEHYGI